MYKISPIHLDRFTKRRYEYLYPVSKGIYLAFDSETLEHIGIELFYLPFTRDYERKAEELLNNLLIKGILEFID